MFGGNYATHMGGPSLNVNTNGAITTATWLAPNGSMSAVNTHIRGRFFGGDVQNQQIVSGLNITAPPIPAPGAAALALLGLAGIGTRHRRRSM